MAQVHQLIALHGVDGARALTTDKLERSCIDAAFAVMTDESQRIGVTHAGFAMTALPHKAQDSTVWVRDGGNVRLRVVSGEDINGVPVGIPYGSIARMILLYLQTEAVKTRSREIELGRSMNQWLSSMGIGNGGKNYKIVREQSRRLSLCRLTFYRVTDEATVVTNGSFVRNAIIPTQGEENTQLSLWRESVKLDEGFYESLIQHPMPVSETAIRQIGQSSQAIDIYVWLAYRLHTLSGPTPITWRAIFDQFGAGWQNIRQFKPRFRDALKLALAAYPDATVTVDEGGLCLYPSAPAVPAKRLVALG